MIIKIGENEENSYFFEVNKSIIYVEKKKLPEPDRMETAFSARYSPIGIPYFFLLGLAVYFSLSYVKFNPMMWVLETLIISILIQVLCGIGIILLIERSGKRNNFEKLGLPDDLDKEVISVLNDSERKDKLAIKVYYVGIIIVTLVLLMLGINYISSPNVNIWMFYILVTFLMGIF